MKSHLKILLSLLLLLLLSSFTLLPEITLAVLAVYLAVVLDILIFRFTGPLRRFTVIRKVGRHQLMVGENVSVSLQVKYQGSFPIVGSLGFGCESLGLDFGTGLLAFKPSTDNTHQYSILAKRRGAHIISPTVLHIRDWLMLSDQKVNTTDQDDILVLPRIYPIRSNVIGTLGARVRGLTTSGNEGRSSEIWGMREYQPFDEYKMISWKSMAKHPDQTPMTKITVGEVGSPVTVIVDVGDDMNTPNGEYVNLDVAADLAASICFSLINGGTKTGLIFYDNKLSKVIKPDRNANHLTSILHHLALVQPSSKSFRMTNLVNENLPTDFGKTFILIIGRIREGTTGAFASALSMLRKHHQIMMIIVHNEDSKTYAESLQHASRQVGVPTFLATSTTIPETLRILEQTTIALV